MPRQPLIDHYEFGGIIIKGVEYDHDLVVTPDGLLKDWWRVEGHRVQLADVRDLLNVRADLVVIGTGYEGMMRVDDEVVESFRRSGLEVHVARSRQAVRRYNDEVSKGRRVLLLIHLTC